MVAKRFRFIILFGIVILFITTATTTTSISPFITGCTLLTEYDTNYNGVINTDEAVNAVIDYLMDDTLTGEQATDILDAYFDESSTRCPVYSPPPLSCDAPRRWRGFVGSFGEEERGGCALLLDYDSNNDGIISRSEWTQSVDDENNGIITQEEAMFVLSAYMSRSINNKCPGCSDATPTSSTTTTTTTTTTIPIPCSGACTTPGENCCYNGKSYICQ